MFKHLLAAACLISTISPVSSQEVARTLSVLPDGTQIVYGNWRKLAPGQVDIPFGSTFSAPPIVVVTSVYPSQIGSIETVTAVQLDKFTVTSLNASPNYSVNWIAIGKR